MIVLRCNFKPSVHVLFFSVVPLYSLHFLITLQRTIRLNWIGCESEGCKGEVGVCVDCPLVDVFFLTTKIINWECWKKILFITLHLYNFLCKSHLFKKFVNKVKLIWDTLHFGPGWLVSSECPWMQRRSNKVNRLILDFSTKAIPRFLNFCALFFQFLSKIERSI